MSLMSEQEYDAMVRWAEQRPWTYEMDPIEVQRLWLKAEEHDDDPRF